MAVIGDILGMLFGGRRNVVREVAEVFRENAEAAGARGHDLDAGALAQFAAEFEARSRRTWWDSLIDGLNRLPRPMLAFWAFWVLLWTARDPAYMAEVFASWVIIPDMVWALIMIIVTFFFGGRAQVKDQAFQRDVAGMVTRTQAVLGQRARLRELNSDPDTTLDPEPIDAEGVDANPALDAWLASRSRKD
jgi:hypothetical protein